MKLWHKIAFLSIILASNIVVAESLSDVMKSRGLTEKDVLAAAETYVPTGKRDEYIVFSSGGQSGQVIVYGIPSMRLLKYIGVFTPEPWQGYGYDEESKAILAEGRIQGKDITFGDTHHPALSETNGDYDGQYLFINDKANPRIAVIDLHDFETKQIVVNPVFKSSHGGTFVSENTDYIIEAAQYPAPYENDYVPLEQFNERYRGGMTYWPFDRKKGRIVAEEAFTVMAPPYSQDLSDFGKGPSGDWSFTNSFCTERYVGGIERGRPPFEAGCSAKDTDFMHVVNWRKAAELVKAGKATKINGHSVITIDTAVKEGILYLIPEPKSPHGVDVSPDGQYIVVSGKLDSHTSVYSFEKIQKAIANKKFEGKDPYGIPIIAMQEVLHTQVELGLGPLHSQYDSEPCVIYTSLYVDSMVAKWNYCTGKVLDKISIHYNIGHLMTMHGDTRHPEGKYLVALNKLAIDRFNPVGPLHPQNHQLIDISGDKMVLLTDMPVPLGEPHYAVGINARLLKPAVRYKSGWNSRTNKRSAYKTRAGREKTVKTPGKVEVFGTTIRSHITPEIIEAEEGDEVIIHLTNLERAEDETHGFALYGHNINLSLEPGKTSSFRFIADKAGVYPYYCTEFCSALHLEMEGYLLVKPKGFEELVTKAEAGTTYTKADYDKQVKENVATQAVIDQVVGFITGQNYQDFPPVVALVEDATDQLGFAKEAKGKSEAAAEKEDWLNAALWANQWWQYQVKAADIGLRAKTYLEQHGAKMVAQVAKPEPTNLKADYEKLEKANLAQLATLNKEVAVILSQNYYDFPAVAALVADLLKQLNVAKKAENKAKAAVDKGDWQNAISQANKWQQAQNKATEIGSQSKTALEQQAGAKIVVGVITTPVTYGATLYKKKACVACHGADGKSSRQSSYPQIAGQSQAYSVVQMKDIKSGVRHNAHTAVMKGIMGAVSDAEIEAITEWLASLPGSAGVVGDSTLAAKGAEIYKSKNTNCIGCHGADANTPLRPDHFPKLAGQNKEYLITQMKDIRDDVRRNGQTIVMTGITQGLSDEDIEALAEWLASLKGHTPPVVVAKTEVAPTEVPVAVTPQVMMPSADVMAMEGATLYKKKGCFACHGPDAKTSLQPLAPKLAGQGKAYTVSQLKDMKSGARHNDTTVMKGIMETVSEAEIEPIAEWLATLPGGAGVTGDATLAAKGAEIYKSKDTNCIGCHGADANTPLVHDHFPKLGGQDKDYLITQMKDIRDGVRNNGQTMVMSGIMQGVSDEEIKALAEWLASLKGTAAPEVIADQAPTVVEPVEKEAPVVVKPVTKLDGAMLYKRKACLTCHGVDAKTPIKPSYPPLAGQNKAYAMAQMNDVKSRARDNGESIAMASIMHTVNESEIEAIADWLAGLDAGLRSEVKAEGLYQSKGCIACHGADANTPIMPTYPKVAGLTEEYAINQMSDIKSGARHNGQSAVMKGIMLNVSDAEIEAIAQWLASLKAPTVAEPEDTKTTSMPVPIMEQGTVEEVDGKTLYNNKGCIACHGVDGKMPIMPNYPKIAGLPQAYAIAMMKDIKSGARHNGQTMIMKGVMSSVSDAEMITIAEWLATLSNGAGTQGDATLMDKGAALYKSKTCIACHGADGKKPILPNYPKLAGQNKAYAIVQMTDIKSGARDNGQTAAMKGVMHLVSDEEIGALAEWLTSLDGESSAPIAETSQAPVATETTEPVHSAGSWNQSGGEKDEAMHLKPNLENGLEVFEVCSACHLPEGWGAKEGTFPQLAGQHRTVLIKQLADIRAKNRDNPTMYPFALPSEIGGPQALADVTGYIAKLPMNPDNGVGAGDDLELGKQLFKDNCVKCHGKKGEGKPDKFYPRIQAQHYKYMLRQFEWIRDGKRRNANPDMVKQIHDFTDRDMKAVIDYVSRIKPPQEDLGEAGWLNPDFD